MRAHLVQFDIVWEDPSSNYERVRSAVQNAEVKRNDLVVLPELFDSGFSFNIHQIADAGGRTLSFLRDLARTFSCTVQGSRTLIGPDHRARNMATVVAPTGDVVCEYAKIHPFSIGRESEHFSAGDTVEMYHWMHDASGSVNVCPAICYDLRFPELFRAGLARNATVFAIGANWPVSRAAHWRALIIARAIENQAYVLGVNRCGSDPTLTYGGGSIAVDPRGEVLAEALNVSTVLSVEIDPDEVAAWRRKFPAWRDIRMPGTPRPEITK
jgi:predicted amidohydrolase